MNEVATILVALGSGVLGALVGSYAQIRMQSQRIEAERINELHRLRREYAVEAETHALSLLQYFSTPNLLIMQAKFRGPELVDHLLARSEQLGRSLAGLELMLPSELAQEVTEFVRGPLNDFIVLSIQLGATLREHPDRQAEIDQQLRAALQEATDTYAPIRNKIRDLLLGFRLQ